MDPIKLVATDLDGTLVRDDGDVSGFTRQVLADLDAGGIHVVFVTARPIRWMEPLREVVGSHGLSILSNGAVEYDLAQQQVVEVRALSPEATGEITGRIRAELPEAAFATETLSGFAKEPHYQEFFAPPPGHLVGPITELLTEPVLKLLVRYAGVPDAVARPVIAGAVQDLANPSWSTTDLVEVAASGVSKASALAQLCRRWRLEPEQVVAFGDMPNDVPMLAWAGHSYAVANADDLAKAAATEVLEWTNNEDGVAKMLHRLLVSGLG